jgi:hypothetical protein
MQPIYTIVLAKEDWKKCLHFGRQVAPTTNYFNDKDMAMDHAVGKAGEIAAQRYLMERFHTQVSEPDFTIYAANHKSYAPDLLANYGQTEVHIKTTTPNRVKYYGASWAFYTNDPAITKPKNNEYGIFVILDVQLYKYQAHIYQPLKMSKVSQLVKPSRFDQYTDNKRYLYADEV